MNKLLKSRNEREDSQMINSIIIWITLGTLFIIPLIFNYFQIVPIFAELKLVTLHLGAGVISILWLWELVIKRQITISIPKQGLHRSLGQWVGRNPTHWTLIGAFVWFTALIISTLLSPLLSISFFGAEDNRSGYNYTTTFHFSSFFFQLQFDSDRH